MIGREDLKQTQHSGVNYPVSEACLPDISHPPVDMQPFMFKEKTGYINWETIGKADVESLQRSGDLGLIQTLAQNLVYSQLRKEDTERISNPSFVKVFKLSQMSIEYLLYVQDVMEMMTKSADLEYRQLHKCCVEQEQAAKEEKEKIAKQKKELRVKKRTIGTYNYLIKESNKNMENQMFPCDVCKDKYYPSKRSLISHYRRRHPSVNIHEEDLFAVSNKKIPESVPEGKYRDENTLNEQTLQNTVQYAVQKEMLKVQEAIIEMNSKLESFSSMKEASEEVPRKQVPSEKNKELTEEMKELQQLQRQEIERLTAEKNIAEEAKQRKHGGLTMTALEPLSYRKLEEDQSEIERGARTHSKLEAQEIEYKIQSVPIISIEPIIKPKIEKDSQEAKEEEKQVPQIPHKIPEEKKETFSSPSKIITRADAAQTEKVRPQPVPVKAALIELPAAVPIQGGIQEAFIGDPVLASIDAFPKLQLGLRSLSDEEIEIIKQEEQKRKMQQKQLEIIQEEKKKAAKKEKRKKDEKKFNKKEEKQYDNIDEKEIKEEKKLEDNEIGKQSEYNQDQKEKKEEENIVKRPEASVQIEEEKKEPLQKNPEEQEEAAIEFHRGKKRDEDIEENKFSPSKDHKMFGSKISNIFTYYPHNQQDLDKETIDEFQAQITQKLSSLKINNSDNPNIILEKINDEKTLKHRYQMVLQEIDELETPKSKANDS